MQQQCNSRDNSHNTSHGQLQLPHSDDEAQPCNSLVQHQPQTTAATIQHLHTCIATMTRLQWAHSLIGMKRNFRLLQTQPT